MPILPMSCNKPDKNSIELASVAAEFRRQCTATLATRSLWPQVYASLASMADVSARTTLEELRLLAIKLRVAGMNGKDCADAAEQACLWVPNSPARTMIECSEPTEQLLTVRQWHDDRLPQCRKLCARLGGRRWIDDERAWIVGPGRVIQPAIETPRGRRRIRPR